MTIRSALPSEFETITNLWEDSVRATHDFLPEAELLALRPQLLNNWLPAVNLRVLTDPHNAIIAFSGVVDGKLEMLFVAPHAFGQGAGKALLQYAIEHTGVRLVDVNEANPKALGFYLHQGFEVVGRSALDGQGKPYPLLHLRLSQTHLA